MVFRTKPQIALELIDRVLANGVRVKAWTADELYGRDSSFLDGLEARRQAFVVEVPVDFHGWVAFGRWSIESCFRQAKEELGLDHYQVRGWRCVHRHFILTQLSHLFCARMRQELHEPSGEQEDRLTLEQIRSAMNTWLEGVDLKPAARKKRFEKELKQQRSYQQRRRQAQKSHTKTRRRLLTELGIDVDKIKSCIRKEAVTDDPNPCQANKN